jgi:hypothetical protein
MLRLAGAGSPPPCCAEKLKFVGLTVSTGAGTVTVAEADFVVSALLAAFTVTVVSLATAGAVNRPALLIMPALLDQLTV